MKTIDLKELTEEIHFPITRALYKKPPKRNFFQRLWKFVTFKRNYEVMEDYLLYIPSLNKWLFIPAGFKYDNASVPKVLNGLYNADGMLLLGSLPHDFGYRYECLVFVNPLDLSLYIEPYTKEQLDHLFKYLCAYESEFPKASGIAGFGLQLFGFLGWKSNRKNYKSLPDDFPEIFIEEPIRTIKGDEIESF